MLTKENRQRLEAIVRKCSAGWPWSDTSGYIQPEQVLECERDIYLFGLDPHLLDIAETYLDEPCFYLGPVLKREAVDLRADGTRQ